MKDIWWARVVFREFSSHFIEMSDEEIVRDIRASLVALVKLNDSGDSFGAAMVKIAKLRLQGSAAKTAQANGRKGGRPRKSEALVSQPKSLPGTSSGNGEALNDEGATAPAGQSFEARQACPGAQPLSASGESFDQEARTPRAATTPVPASAQAVPEQGALPPEASTGRGGQLSTPVPASAHGNAAVGGLLTPWYGPEAGEHFDQGTGRRLPAKTRADAHAREDWDASATVRAQSLGGDAATREGAVDILTPQGGSSEPGNVSADISKRPGKSAESSISPMCRERKGGSERGAGGTAIDAVRRSPGAKNAEQRLRYGSAGNVLMTATEMARLAAEFGDVRTITEELSDYLLLHPNKYRSHYAALRNWCRRRIRDGLNPDGTRMTQGDRLARHFAMREKEILDGKDAKKE